MYNWKYGENDCQNYYDQKVNGKYLLVFANKKYPNAWMGMIDNRLILDKTRMDAEIERKVKAKESMNTTYIFLSNESPEYMKEKVEYCFEHDLDKI